MAFYVVIPARLASSRLPRKPLADIAGLPMVVRVAQAASRSAAARVIVAVDDSETLAVCQAAGVEALLTRSDHATGSDRLAEVCEQLALQDDAIVVNVQGDEPLIDPLLINAVAAHLAADPSLDIASAAHPISEVADYLNPHAVKVVLNAKEEALYFSRAPIPWWRDGNPGTASTEFRALPTPAPLRHIGLYAYRVGFIRAFPSLSACPLEQTESLEQLRALWHGYRIGMHTTLHTPAAGVDTPEDLERVRAIFQQNVS